MYSVIKTVTLIQTYTGCPRTKPIFN